MAGTLVGGVIVLMLVPLPSWGRASGSIGDMVHAPLFGTVTFALLWMLQKWRPARIFTHRFNRRALCVATGMALFGIGMEVSQRWWHRSPSIYDATSNALGIAAAVACFYAWMHRGGRRSNRRHRYLLLFTAFALLLISWRKPIPLLYDCYVQSQEFPALASFESHAELDRWFLHSCRLSLIDANATDGRFAGEFRTKARQYSGITLIEPPNDWSDYKSLELDVYLAESPNEQPVSFVIRIVDEVMVFDNRPPVESVWKLVPGQPFPISLSLADVVANSGADHTLDLAKIMYLNLWLMSPTDDMVLRLDNVYLKP